MTTNDVDYYMMRERQERRHAAHSKDASARRIHLEMAERYLEKLTSVVMSAAGAGRA